MIQIITTKLKLHHTSEQKILLDQFSLSFRDAMNYVSQVAFDNGKTSNNIKLHEICYRDIRSIYKLPSTVACSVCRKIGSTYQSLWTKYNQHKKHVEKGYTKKRYKGLDKPPKYSSRTTILCFRNDYSFPKNDIVSISTLEGRIKMKYSGYSKHLELLKSTIDKVKIGSSNLYYDKKKKQYYLLVSLTLYLSDISIETKDNVIGVDVGIRNLAVTTDSKDNISFYKGGNTIHISNRYSRLRKELQKKDTRSSKRKLISISGRERRFKSNINHVVSKDIVGIGNSIIGVENLKDIRVSTKRKMRVHNTSKKQRKWNRNYSNWSFSELQNYISYKSNLNDSIMIKIDSDYTSQMCIKCGYTSKENRPGGSVIFKCKKCGYELHSDLIGSRNLLMRTILIRQDLMSTGCLSTIPDVTHDETKTERLTRYSGLRWSVVTNL